MRSDDRQRVHPSVSESSVELTHRLQAGQYEGPELPWEKVAAEAVARRLWSAWCRYAYGSIPLIWPTSLTYAPSSEASTNPVSTAGDAARHGRTIASSRCSSAAVGFLQQPVCTGDICMTVLRG